MGSGRACDEADELERTHTDDLRVGPAARPLLDVLSSLSTVVEALDPAQVPARDAVDLVRVLDRISRVTEAAKALAAHRVAESSLWSRAGHRSPAQWMAAVTGVGVGDAVRSLSTAEVVAEAPGTRDALVAGKVSARQARAAGRAEKADPVAGRHLLGRLTAPGSSSGMSVTELEKEATRIAVAASSETPEETAARHRRARRFRHGVTADGMGWGSWLLPPAAHVAVVAQLEAEQQEVFEAKRAAGEREPSEAYAADALLRMFRRARRGDAPTPSSGGDAGDDWSFAKVVVKVDLGALDRGHTQPGEVCEVAGQGPIPVDEVWRMIDGDAFVAAVATRGVEISRVVHLGRRPTALQRTALDWLDDGTCSIEGCTSKARLEIDHVADWAATRRTELSELTRACGHHHDLKTHHGYRFGPRRADGTRRLVPPVDPEADASTAAARPAGASSTVVHPQQGFFDTG